MAHVQIIRRPGVPETPSPFFADGRPAWSAFLDSKALRLVHDMTNDPGPGFKRDVAAVYIDGVKVYPKD
jgi:hypothetical protein